MDLGCRIGVSGLGSGLQDYGPMGFRVSVLLVFCCTALLHALNPLTGYKSVDYDLPTRRSEPQLTRRPNEHPRIHEGALRPFSVAPQHRVCSLS